MPPITRITPKKVLYRELGHHLLNDSVPSVFLNSIKNKPEFHTYPFDLLARLRGTQQPPKHHPEGNVWNHTLLVVDEAASVKDRSKDARVFLWAALLHDIGKPVTTRVRDGRITSYDHDKVGAELAKKFLDEFTDNAAFIGRVSALIRYHMQVLYVDRDLPFADIRGILEHVA